MKRGEYDKVRDMLIKINTLALTAPCKGSNTEGGLITYSLPPVDLPCAVFYDAIYDVMVGLSRVITADTHGASELINI